MIYTINCISCGFRMSAERVRPNMAVAIGACR
jgi:hypothetical protein